VVGVDVVVVCGEGGCNGLWNDGYLRRK